MSMDKQKLKALAEAATQSHGARRVEVDHNGVHVIGDGSWKILSAWHTPDGKGAQNAEFAAAASPATVLALLAEIDQLKAENEALRKDAERYRFVSKLAWYVDAASHVYNVCNVNAQWSDQRGHPDTDDIESAIDATMAGGKAQ